MKIVIDVPDSFAAYIKNEFEYDDNEFLHRMLLFAAYNLGDFKISKGKYKVILTGNELEKE